jgi:hypothetical protein
METHCISKQTKNVTFFPFTKNQRAGGYNKPCLGFGTSERGEDVEKKYRRVNVGQILYTHAFKWKNDTC